MNPSNYHMTVVGGYRIGRPMTLDRMKVHVTTELPGQRRVFVKDWLGNELEITSDLTFTQHVNNISAVPGWMQELQSHLLARSNA